MFPPPNPADIVIRHVTYPWPEHWEIPWHRGILTVSKLSHALLLVGAF
jgi:hypothetical protein